MNKVESSNDHSKCVIATNNEVKVDYDAQLIDNEGDPLEEFEQTSNSMQVKFTLQFSIDIAYNRC